MEQAKQRPTRVSRVQIQLPPPLIHGDDDDDNMSLSEGDESTEHSPKGNSNKQGQNHHIAERETNAVKCLKVTFITILTILAVALSVFIYLRIHGNEVEEFETDFMDRAEMIVDHFGTYLEQRMQAIGGLSTQLTSYTSDYSAGTVTDINSSSASPTWPLVTIPDFDIRAASARSVVGSWGIIMTPLVMQTTRLIWEIYANEKVSTWLPTSMERQNSNNKEATDMLVVGNSKPLDVAGSAMGIWRHDDERDEQLYDDGLGPYFPIWHSSPVSREAINFNLASDVLFRDGLLSSLETKKAVLGEAIPLNATMLPIQTLLQESLVEQQKDEEAGIQPPVSVLYYPVFDNFALANSDDRSLVAMLLDVVYWPTSFEAILPPDALGYVCVLTSDCGQSYTYRLNGPNVEYLGAGDLHDTRYDYLGESHNLSNIVTSNSSSQLLGLKVPEVLLDDDYCPHSLRIYPSRQLEELYLSDMPILLAVCVGSVFFVTVLLFAIYDKLVERRQKLVMKFALESHAIVSSLFPATVRGRLFGAAGLGILSGRRKSQLGANQTDPTSVHNDKNTSIESGEHTNDSPPAPPLTLNPVRMIRRRSMDHKQSWNDGPSPDGSSLNRGSRHDDAALNSSCHRQSSKELKKGTLDNSCHNKQSGLGSNSSHRQHGGTHQSPKRQLQKLAGSSPSGITVLETPIADLFPNSTVFFADIAGFTAWSSQREPTQVFTLLQTIYHGFDRVANKRHVFKVETIGDCYMAVTGLPNPQEDHAVRMARFAKECIHQMNVITKGLEVRLGPDTGELTLRIGLHSGPVTAGVLLGEKSRFQLFGDTVNTASRMESTGEKNKIQVSQATASLLIEAGKGAWIIPRRDKVTAKGKGEMQTYWIVGKGQQPGRQLQRSNSGGLENINKDEMLQRDAQATTTELRVQNKKTPVDDEKYRRMIEWQVDLLARMLKKIHWRRANTSSRKIGRSNSNGVDTDSNDSVGGQQIVIDEVLDTIVFPQVSSKQGVEGTHPDSVELSPEVIEQLRNYVKTVAGLYRLNHFHNFEHATHVTQAIHKFLNRIDSDNEKESDVVGSQGYLCGLMSDPLLQFAVVLAGLVHDVDHPGVSNERVMKEDSRLAEFYHRRSVNEQNSVDVAWGVLLEPAHKDLLSCICRDDGERRRFRQILVNSVIATDLYDKDMKESRETRWKRAFHRKGRIDDGHISDPAEDIGMTNLKATLIIEYVLQAADIVHTMQHFHIYQKFNQMLFEEMYSAYENGRAVVDPSRKWYETELEFFDKFVIPLAEKLDECNILGVASQECLAYARANRQEWILKGESAVHDMVSTYQQRKFQSTLKKTTGGVDRRSQMGRRFSIATTQA